MAKRARAPQKCAYCDKAALGSQPRGWLFLRWWVNRPARKSGPWCFCSGDCLRWWLADQPYNAAPYVAENCPTK